ncbi:MAG: M1 family metallopeptidase [Phycisphaerales bacterium]|nr:M1 family metallopeptidase [Phycisphaerales bacterium]
MPTMIRCAALAAMLILSACETTPKDDAKSADTPVATATPPAPAPATPAPAPTPATTPPAPPPRAEARPDRPAAQKWAGSIFDPLDLPTPTSIRGGSGAPGPDYWQQRADYVINATLDADANTITGREVLTYTNNSPDVLPYVWISLEQNLFKSDSLGSLTTPPRTRFANRDSFEGGFKIDSIRIGKSGAATIGPGDAGQPAGDSADVPYHTYDTLAKLDLPAPIAARGGKLVLEIAWSFKIPKYGSDRMGMRDGDDGTVYELAQWFPAVAKYDDVYGWNTIPYYGQGEFYTDFGSYTVSLTVPRSHLVFCTGVLQNESDVLTQVQRDRLATARTSDTTVVIRGQDEVKSPDSRPAGEGPLTWTFHADDVRTVAWASSPAFVWDASFLQGTGPEGKGTLCQSAYPVEAMEHWPKSTGMLRASIEGYSHRWFKYPYPVATNVNGVAGGMEYPMIIFCGGRGSEDGLFGVTTHEIGHNWFPMVVNSDERRHAWMDEGFNTFINYYAEQDWSGELGRRGSARGFAGFMRQGNQQPMETFADRVNPGRLGVMQYEKTSVGLVMLREHILGEERFDEAFREYIRRWAFKSPQPADFFRTMEDAAGMDLAWFWRGWFLGTGTLDQELESVRLPTGSGTSMRITMNNLNELVMPVDLRVTFADGSTLDRSLPAEVWRYTNHWTTAIDTGGKVVTKVQIDPDGAYPDVDRKNNDWTAPVPVEEKPTPAAPPAEEKHQE